MTKLEKNIQKVSKMTVDTKQAEMIKEIRTLVPNSPTYDLATPNEIFQLGLKQSQNRPVQSATGIGFSFII